MLVGSVMSVRVVTSGPDESVHTAIQRMVDAQIGSVLVVEGPRLVGILTERDVLRLASEGADFRELHVADAMTPSPLSIAPDVHILDAAQLMGERGIRHLPVVEDGNLHGVVGIRDVLRSLVERAWRDHDGDARETAQTLLARSQR